MPLLPFFCPAKCGHLNEHVDDQYLIEYGVCAACWFKLENIPGMKEASVEERIAKLRELEVLRAARAKEAF